MELGLGGVGGAGSGFGRAGGGEGRQVEFVGDADGRFFPVHLLNVAVKRSKYNHFGEMVFISYYSLLLLFFYTFIEVSPQTYLCSPSCLSCLYSELKCTACDEGYELTLLGRCLKTNGSYNCALFGNTESQCLQCKPTYRLQNGTCLKDYSGCLEESNGSCSRCQYGTILNGSRCEGVLNCAKYDPGCLYCEKGYIFNSNRCFYVQRDCAKVDVKSGACELCSPGLILVGFSCLNSSAKIRNCDISDQSGCIICKSGFGLLSGSCVAIPNCPTLQYVSQILECTDLPWGCKQFNSSSQLCSLCFQNFRLLNGTCSATLPAHCLKVIQNGECTVCQDRFYPERYTCMEVSKYCKDYNSIGRCTSCSHSYFKNQAGICKDPYCLNSTLTSCRQCRQSYLYDQTTSRCLISDPHCLSSSQVSCLSCSQGYYPSTDICLPLPDACRQANSKGECLKCQDNYFLQFNKCFTIAGSIPNCVRYDSYSYVPRCVECEVGFLVVLGKCVLIPPYCSMFLSDGKCVICFDRFNLTPSGQCSPKDQKDTDLNCVLKTEGKCVRCASGFVLGINNACYQSVPSCQKRDGDGICLYCGQTFVLSRQACLSGSFIDMNCKTYEGALCRQCYAGYYLSENACKLPNIDCKSYDPSNGGCNDCYPGYTLTNRQCVVLTKIQNCQAYDGKGNCLKCSKFYFLNSSVCQQVNPLCSAYDEYTGSCRSCFSGFQLSNGSCFKKEVASWYDPTKMALVTIQICEKYDQSSGKCSKCILGYFLQGGKCINYASLVGADPSCKTYANSSQCLQCYSGFIAIKGQCRGVDPLCRTVNTSNGECSSCYQGYNLAFGRCGLEGRAQTDPCLQKQQQKCVNCTAGYNLIEGSCIYDESQYKSYSIPYCQMAVNSSYCSLCQNGFYARQGVCYQVSPFCMTYNASTGACLTCKDSYVFSEGTCIFPALGIDAFCSEYTGVYCGKCLQGYYLKNYRCTVIDRRCLQFNFSVNQCLRCSSGVPMFDQCQ